MEDLRDIYFTDDYCKIYEKNGEGILETFVLEESNAKLIYKFLKREIKSIDGKVYFDITTPYGYGGPLIISENKEYNTRLIEKFKVSFKEYCKNNNIVSEFVRFHPIEKNYLGMEDYMEIEHIRDTVYIEIGDEDKILDNMVSECRTAIRKAIKNNVEIVETRDLKEFKRLYIDTMKKNNATEYYFFSDEFLNNTMDFLSGNIKIFNAKYNGKVVSSVMSISYGEYIHYHLSGSDSDYSKYRPVNLLIYEMCIWGNKIGAKYLHLGGGYSGNDDNLFRFKKKFSKYGRGKFYIGKKIYIQDIYDKLVEENNKIKEGAINQGYFPLYRG